MPLTQYTERTGAH